MALGRRKNERQQDFWVATTELPRSEGHVFYQKLNKLLREAGFDEYLEKQAGGATSGGDQQPPPREGKSGASVTATTKRTRGTELRLRLWDGR